MGAGGRGEESAGPGVRERGPGARTQGAGPGAGPPAGAASGSGFTETYRPRGGAARRGSGYGQVRGGFFFQRRVEV